MSAMVAAAFYADVADLVAPPPSMRLGASEEAASLDEYLANVARWAGEAQAYAEDARRRFIRVGRNITNGLRAASEGQDKAAFVAAYGELEDVIVSLQKAPLWEDEDPTFESVIARQSREIAQVSSQKARYFRRMSSKILQSFQGISNRRVAFIAAMVALRDELAPRLHAIRIEAPVLYERHQHDHLFRAVIARHPVVNGYLAR